MTHTLNGLIHAFLIDPYGVIHSRHRESYALLQLWEDRPDMRHGRTLNE